LTVDLRGLTVAAGAVWVDGDEWMRHGRAVLVGRETELTALRHLLDPGSLVTVVGPGGVGKTRLALAAADDVQVPEPVVCELAGVTDPAQVAGAVGEALGFPSLRVALVGLAETERLLVLDNCEHLLDAVAEVAELLLQDCPRVAILATSREPLAVPGEHVLRLHSLALPATDDPTGSRPRRPSSCSSRGRARRVHRGCSTARRPRTLPGCAAGWTGSRWRSSWPPPGLPA
jgi:hypothetical protein